VTGVASPSVKIVYRVDYLSPCGKPQIRARKTKRLETKQNTPNNQTTKKPGSWKRHRDLGDALRRPTSEKGCAVILGQHPRRLWPRFFKQKSNSARRHRRHWTITALPAHSRCGATAGKYWAWSRVTNDHTLRLKNNRRLEWKKKDARLVLSRVRYATRGAGQSKEAGGTAA